MMLGWVVLYITHEARKLRSGGLIKINRLIELIYRIVDEGPMPGVFIL
jgi:hypothetical protein